MNGLINGGGVCLALWGSIVVSLLAVIGRGVHDEWNRAEGL